MRLVGLCSSRWSRNACLRRILPVPVTRNRLAAPRCVFILGMVVSLGEGRVATGRSAQAVRAQALGLGRRLLCLGLGGADTRLAQGVQHHRHVATVLAGRRLDRGVLGHLLRDPLEDLAPDLRVRHLAAPEHDRELDLRSFAQEALDVLHLGFEVVPVDLGPELHLLDDDVGRPLARFLASLILFVLPLAEVHDPANRRISVRRNLDEVESLFACHRERLGKRLHPVLGAVAPDEQDLASANAIVDAGVVSGQSGFSSCRRSRRETAADSRKPAAGTARLRGLGTGPGLGERPQWLWLRSGRVGTRRSRFPISFLGGYQREQHLDPFRRVSAERRARRHRAPAVDAATAAGTTGGEAADISPEELEAMRRLHEQLRATPGDRRRGQPRRAALPARARVPRRRGGGDDAAGAPVADLVQASIVIDTMAAIVDGLGPRLARARADPARRAHPAPAALGRDRRREQRHAAIAGAT